MAIPKYLLLDLDDTILDYDSTGMACWAYFYGQYAPRLKISIPDLQHAVEGSRRWFWSDMRRYRVGRNHQLEARRAILHRAFRDLEVKQPALAEEFADRFTREREEWIRIFPGAVASLEQMRSSGARMALVTNGQGSQQRAKVNRFQLADYFDVIWIEGERGIGKPEPEVFRQVVAQLGGRLENSWMVGDDARFDIRPAHELGLHTAWLDIGRDRRDGIPYDIIAPSLEALCAIWTKN